MALGDQADDALDVRISNAERDIVTAQLRGHVVDGRLTLDEFSDRMAEVYKAKTQRDLEAALRELPRPLQLPVPEPTREQQRAIAAEQRRRNRERHRKELAGFLMPNIVCTAIWYMTTGGDSYFWPQWVLFGTGI